MPCRQHQGGKKLAVELLAAHHVELAVAGRGRATADSASVNAVGQFFAPQEGAARAPPARRSASPPRSRSAPATPPRRRWRRRRPPAPAGPSRGPRPATRPRHRGRGVGGHGDLRPRRRPRCRSPRAQFLRRGVETPRGTAPPGRPPAALPGFELCARAAEPPLHQPDRRHHGYREDQQQRVRKVMACRSPATSSRKRHSPSGVMPGPPWTRGAAPYTSGRWNSGITRKPSSSALSAAYSASGDIGARRFG